MDPPTPGKLEPAVRGPAPIESEISLFLERSAGVPCQGPSRDGAATSEMEMDGIAAV